MTENARRPLDALEVLMQDHREIESLFRDFDHLRNARKDTSVVISAACAELKIHDTLKTTVFYALVDDATDDEAIQALLDAAEDEHDDILESIEEIERSRTDPRLRDERFATLSERVKQHFLREEAELFPLVRKLPQLDLESVAAAMVKRRGELTPEIASPPAHRETV